MFKNYADHEYSWLIRQRAEERREREELRRTNEDATRVYVPFTEWLYYHHAVDDWMKLRKHALWELYNDYQLDCLRHRMEYEHPSRYGVKNTIL